MPQTSDPRESNRLGPVFRVFLVLLVVATIETLSCASLHLMEWKAPSSMMEIFLANHFQERVTTARKEKAVRRTFHPELGWLVRPGLKKTSTASDGREWTYSANENCARSAARETKAPCRSRRTGVPTPRVWR